LSLGKEAICAEESMKVASLRLQSRALRPGTVGVERSFLIQLSLFVVFVMTAARSWGWHVDGIMEPA
jgi:hypothetical protein